MALHTNNDTAVKHIHRLNFIIKLFLLVITFFDMYFFVSVGLVKAVLKTLFATQPIMK
jgi:hypothetical protein